MPLPPWIKGAAAINPATISIDSIHAVGTTPAGGTFGHALWLGDDRYEQDINPPGGHSGTQRIEVKFTVRNTAHRAVAGFVEGHLDQTSLGQHQVPSLAHGATNQGTLSFAPLKVHGDHVLMLQFREPTATKTGQSVSFVLAWARVGYFASDHIIVL